MILYSEDDLVEAFEGLEGQDIENLLSVTEVQMVVASYDPLKWQVNVKLRDRGQSWGTCVSDNPGDALVGAIKHAYGSVKGSAYYHTKRPLAEEFRQGVEDIYGSLIAYTKTEFEPNRGFVVVVSPKPGKEAKLEKLRGKVEFREYTGGPDTKKAAPKKGTASPTPSASTSPGKGAEPKMPKGDMEQIWKDKHGKFPPRDWKKADLWDKLVEERLV